MQHWVLLVATSFVTVLAAVEPALAGEFIRVPEPSTLGLLSAGAAVVAVGIRWIRRR